MHHFQYRDGALFAEDVDVTALAGTVGTPFYVYSAATLRRHVRVMRDPLTGAALAGLERYCVAGERLAIVDGDLWVHFTGKASESKLLGARADEAAARPLLVVLPLARDLRLEPGDFRAAAENFGRARRELGLFLRPLRILGGRNRGFRLGRGGHELLGLALELLDALLR